MARQIRIEYEGALYHVMARGDRREAIVRDDEDRKMFVRTLGDAAEKAGFRIHAYVLMTNHYHVLLETPRANLAAGMGWFQNAFTRRMNTRHGLWGHLFGGRYKAILAEPGPCFWALMDYIHLNPVRAGIVHERDGLEAHAWSSLRSYLGSPGKRPAWLETAKGFEVCGCADTAAGRREFLGLLEKRVDWRKPVDVGTSFPAGEGKPDLAVYSALRRGWLFGSQKFREEMLGLVEKRKKRIQKANGYHGPQLHDHGEKRARRLISAGLAHFEVDLATFQGARKGDWRKGLLAAMIHAETTMKLDWISEQLHMGTRAGVCRLAADARERRRKDRRLRGAWEAILEMSKING